MLSLLLGGVAVAGSAAVLEVDGYGVSYDQALMVTEAVRGALAAEGSLRPIGELERVDRLQRGHEAAVPIARQRVLDAREALDRGRTGLALELLDEALEQHREAASAWARRPELADVYYVSAQVLTRMGRDADARARVMEAEALYPAYADLRAVDLSPELRVAFDKARTELASLPPRRIEPATLRDLQARLEVDALVVGALEADGTLTLLRVEDGATTSEARTRLGTDLPYPGDPVYDALVRDLLGAPDPVAASPAPDAPRVAAPTRGEPRRSAKPQDEPLAITGASRAPRKPLSERRWLWAVGGVAVAGGAAAGVVAAVISAEQRSGPVASSDDTHYTIVVER